MKRTREEGKEASKKTHENDSGKIYNDLIQPPFASIFVVFWPRDFFDSEIMLFHSVCGENVAI